MGLGEPHFRVGALPQQKPAQPLFARGADHQIGIRLAGGVEVLRDGFDGDGVDELLCGGTVGKFLAEQSAHRVGDLLAAAVTDGDVDVKLGVRSRHRSALHRLAQSPCRLFAEQFEITDGAHAPSVRRCADLFDDLSDDLDQTPKFAGFALKVLGGEQVDRCHLDAGIGTPPQHLGNLVRADPVAVADVLVSGIAGPPPVAVAQHRDVPRQRGLGKCEFLAQTHLVEPIGRLFESRRNELHD